MFLNRNTLLLILMVFTVQFNFAQRDTLRYDIDDITKPNENLSNVDFSNSIQKEIVYNPNTNTYEIVSKIGDTVVASETLSAEDFATYSRKENIKEYWKERVNYDLNQYRSVQEPDLSMYLDTSDNPIFDVKPFGNFNVIAGYRGQKVDNPTLPIRRRKTGGPEFDMNIRMGATGSIADRLNFDANYNTESNFNFNRNQFKVGYQGKEDDILKSVEFGNVSLPLRSTLIQGNQSLLGVKSSFQFGRLTATAVMSQQESQQRGIKLEGGAQKKNFEISALDYEANKHFFLSQYFRDQYESNLRTLPALNTPYNITRIQVWSTNRSYQTTNIREFAAFTDLGEPEKIYSSSIQGNPAIDYTDNESNTLYNNVFLNDNVRKPQTAIPFLGGIGLQQGDDYEIITARLLNTNEFTFNRDLGYISLNRTLAPDEVLAVAFEYIDINGEVHRVGEFSENVGLTTNTTNTNSQDQMLVLKLLKPKAPRTDLPTWDLMMKNIYNLGAYQVDQADFRLDVYYNEAGGGLKRYLLADIQNPTTGALVEDEVPIIRLLGLDRFNSSSIAFPDGVFDYLPNYTIDTRLGKLIFPVLEPFGDNIDRQLVNATDKEQFVFEQLYTQTKTQAALYPEFNRYKIIGTYKTKLRDEILLGATSIPRGSVNVRASGMILREGLDYTVDYNLGRVKIINPALLNASVPIDVSFENNLQLGFQSKRLAGTRLDYFVNDKLGLGATVMNLQERPFTNKVNLGSDPVSNTVLGADITYETSSDWLTRAVDKIPGINTKAESSVAFQAEYARFMPGHSKQIGRGTSGQVYVDDFEGASSFYDLKFPPENWTISSVPQRFPESQAINSRASNDNRAKIAWYNIDPILNSNNSSSNGRPAAIGADDRSDVYARQVLEREVFPNISNEQNITVPLTTFDVSYYPAERGPYNFNVDDLNANGTFQTPREKWAGIMRNISVTDFQAANIEFVEFWLMDPFINTDERPNNNSNSGKLILNLGNISEDILYDGRMFFENGLPEPGQASTLDQTNLGLIPTTLNINNAFAATEDGLRAQDVGYDGLDNEQEASFFDDYFNKIRTQFGTSSQAYQLALLDPAADDFHHFLGDDYDSLDLGIVERYKNFSNPHGNSSGSLDTDNQFVYNSTNIPDSEDVNRDNTLERTEAYYEYEIDLSRNDLRVGENYIVSKVETNVELPDGSTENVNWYQFKVPLNNYKSAVNNIQGFQSIRFVRMYLTEFNQPTTLRFARFNLIRNQWRRYEYEIDNRNQPINPNVDFNVFPVNIEENQNKTPFPYTLPPGIVREQIQGAASSFQRNEQSLAMNICDLPSGDTRAIYKLVDLDLRLYDNLKMFVHAEDATNSDGGVTEMNMIVRVGSDFSQNYYEFKQPVEFSTEGQFDQFNIWPEANNVDVKIKDWINLKRERNSNGASILDPYYNSDRTLSVVGSPDLGRSSYVMIGFENMSAFPSCSEFWVNELRVSGLNENSGYAALATADINLADFGSVSFNGNLHSAGYGGIEQRVDERFRDDLTEFGVSGNFNLDKFLPGKSLVKLPMYASYSKSVSTPEFNPYETDLKLSDANQATQDLFKDEVEIKTVNFTNVRKERNPKSERAPKVYDIENFNVSYSYTEKNAQNDIIANDVDRTHYGALGYNYNPKEKPIRPFYGLIGDQKYLRFIKDFNINLVPSSLSFTTDTRNRLQETSLRDIQQPEQAISPYYFKDWTWNRNYDMKWDLTNSLNLNFSAQNQSIIDQPDGRNNTQIKKDSVWNNIKDFGRNTLYQHNASATYSVPFEKFPILDWVGVDVNYSTDYKWLTAPQEYNPITQQVQLNTLGNAIRNSQGVQVNANLDLTNLYNKSGFLKQYQSTRRGRTNSRTRTRPDAKKESKDSGKESTKKKEAATKSGGLGFIVKPLTSVKRVSVNYSTQRGTFVPGFVESPNLLGLNLNANAPGVDFVFGKQPNRDWLDKAAQNNWLSKDEDFSYQFLQDRTKDIRGQATLQPFNDLNIDVNLNYSKTDNYSELFRNTGTVNNPTFEHLNGYESGAYNISFISFNTLFQKRENGEIPQVFKTFEDNRIEASKILSDLNPNSNGTYSDNPNYQQGYGPYSPDVILPSFIAAYTGKNVSEVELNPFNTKPLPNWSLSYSGLTRLPFFKDKFSSFRINHSYQSSFSINQYNSNLKYEGPEDYFLPSAYDDVSNNYYSYYYIPQAIIQESFSPLAGFDFALKNGLTVRANYSKTRTLGMSLLDYQLSEANNTGVTIGAGYQTNNLKLPFGNKVLENDIIFRLDYNYMDDLVTNFKLDQNVSLPTRGAKTISLFPTIDYTLNDRTNVQFYLDRRVSEPKTRSAYPVKNTRGGMKFSYTFR